MLKQILKICLLSLPIVIYFIVIEGKSLCVIGKVSQGMVCSAIMKAGIIYGICTTPFDENKEYSSGLIDNTLTRYSSNLFFTGCWNCEKQQLFKEKGWHKYDILETVYEERALISINTPAKVIASCGHCYSPIFGLFSGYTMLIAYILQQK